LRREWSPGVDWPESQRVAVLWELPMAYPNSLWVIPRADLAFMRKIRIVMVGRMAI
jgi:hypothetical protein